MAPARIMNSLRKVANGGHPTIASAPPATRTAVAGMTVASPFTPAISLVP